MVLVVPAGEQGPTEAAMEAAALVAAVRVVAEMEVAGTEAATEAEPTEVERAVMAMVGVATEEGSAVKVKAATVVALVATLRVVAKMEMAVTEAVTVAVGSRAEVMSAKAEAAMAGVASAVEERAGAWMEEAVMGVEAIGVMMVVVVVME